MPKDTKSLGNNKAPACESRGFVRKRKKGCILTHLPQHKHKIKHDKTTVQSACLYQRGISTALVYSHTREQLQVDHIKLNKSTLICSSYQMIKQKNAIY